MREAGRLGELMEVVKRTPELSSRLSFWMEHMSSRNSIIRATPAELPEESPASRDVRTAMREQGWAPCCLLRVNEVVGVGFGGRGGDE